MPETLCPRCGHTPIPGGSEQCPRCHEPFSFLASHKRKHLRLVDGRTVNPQGEATEIGGNITSVLTEHPREPAAVLALGALLWLVKALPLGVGGEVAPWGAVLFALGAGAAVLLLVRRGPARRLAQLAAAAQLGAAGYLAVRQGLSLWSAAALLHGGVAVSMGVGQMGDVRRVRSFIAGMALGGAALLFTFVRAAQVPPERKLVVEGYGLSLTLPEPLHALPAARLLPHLVIPDDLGTGRAVGFGDAGARAYGLLYADRDGDAQLISGCQRLRRLLGGAEDAQPLRRAAPRAFGREALVYPFDTRTGARGLLACGRMEDGRMLALGLLDASAGGGTVAFDALGEQLRVD